MANWKLELDVGALGAPSWVGVKPLSLDLLLSGERAVCIDIGECPTNNDRWMHIYPLWLGPRTQGSLVIDYVEEEGT